MNLKKAIALVINFGIKNAATPFVETQYNDDLINSLASSNWMRVRRMRKLFYYLSIAERKKFIGLNYKVTTYQGHFYLTHDGAEYLKDKEDQRGKFISGFIGAVIGGTIAIIPSIIMIFT